MEQTIYALNDAQKELELERRELEREREEFRIQKQLSERQKKSEEQLFRMKWKVLETELSKLANEKLEVEEQKKLFFQQYSLENEEKVETGMFFAGVSNVLALKKRHRDLIKIYHPDNVAGDTKVIQEINREYEKLQKVL